MCHQVRRRHFVPRARSPILVAAAAQRLAHPSTAPSSAAPCEAALWRSEKCTSISYGDLKSVASRAVQAICTLGKGARACACVRAKQHTFWLLCTSAQIHDAAWQRSHTSLLDSASKLARSTASATKRRQTRRVSVQSPVVLRQGLGDSFAEQTRFAPFVRKYALFAGKCARLRSKNMTVRRTAIRAGLRARSCSTHICMKPAFNKNKSCVSAARKDKTRQDKTRARAIRQEGLRLEHHLKFASTFAARQR